MKESPHNSKLSDEIEQKIGGKVIKISDKVTLGLPDSLHYADSLVTFYEVKIGARNYVRDGVDFNLECEPWRSVNDRRQYETCRNMSKNALVLYVIYYPDYEMTAVIPMDMLERYDPVRSKSLHKWLVEGPYFVKGHGVDRIAELIDERRKQVYDRLALEY